MCGITGVFSAKGNLDIQYEQLKVMTDCMLHRGPDGSGYEIGDCYAFGHRRLSILDLSDNGKQPMYDNSGEICIVFNGEIYDFVDIRNKLQSLGYVFKSETDTEVIIYAYKEWGIESIKQFNGMFAIALYDLKKRKFFLVRDRVGIKPLYYSLLGDKVIFGSEVKAILNYPGFEREINPQSISSYLSYRYVIGKETFFKNIFSLEPGHYIEVGENIFEDKKYWDLPIVCHKKDKGETVYLKEAEDLLTDSVKKMMVADVSVGAYLSGGLDSSLIVSLMCENQANPPITYTIGFKEKNFSEFEYSGKVANKYKTNHKKIVMDGQTYLKNIRKIICLKDAPLSVPNEVPLYIMSKELKKDFTVVLSGEGADEVFGGYGRILRSPLDYYRLQLSFFPFTKIFGKVFKNYTGKLKTKIDYFINKYSYFSWQEKKEIFNQEMISLLNNDKYCRGVFENFFARSKVLKFYDQITYIFIKFHIIGLLLRLDATTMGASVEGRVPFLDHRLIEYMSKVPFKYKIRMNSSFKERFKALFLSADEISEKLDVTKYLLRKISKNRLPKEIIERKKVGFPVPLNEWFVERSQGYIKNTLLNKDAKLKKFFDQEKLEKWLEEKFIKKDDKLFGQKIWRLFNLELWLQEYF